MKRKQLGDLGERVAEHFLKAKGFKILERKYAVKRLGEVDIIAENSRFRTFVEVKLSRSAYPEEHITPEKIATIQKVAQQYLQRYPTKKQIRFDVVLITVEDEGMVKTVRWIEDAF
ncbi:MAG: YraN family protein [bacterium JZ-2024 1]